MGCIIIGLRNALKATILRPCVFTTVKEENYCFYLSGNFRNSRPPSVPDATFNVIKIFTRFSIILEILFRSFIFMKNICMVL